jgi:hypothetical protein
VDHDDNIFDDDDALDYIMYNEVEKEAQRPSNQNQSGCLGLIVLLAIPTCLLGLLIKNM